MCMHGHTFGHLPFDSPANKFPVGKQQQQLHQPGGSDSQADSAYRSSDHLWSKYQAHNDHFQLEQQLLTDMRSQMDTPYRARSQTNSTHACTPMHAHTHAYTHAHMHACTHMHTHTHTHTEHLSPEKSVQSSSEIKTIRIMQHLGVGVGW